MCMCGNNRIALSVDCDPRLSYFAISILSLSGYTTLRIQNQILTVADHIIRI